MIRTGKKEMIKSIRSGNAHGIKTGRERKVRRKAIDLAYKESHDIDLVAKMNAEQEREAALYESWKNGKDDFTPGRTEA